MTDTRSPVFNKRYELESQIARGGTAQVYLARDIVLGRRIALKVLYAELSNDSAFVERFRREAQAAAGLAHANIVPVFDWGESENTYFIVMEYVDGEPLSSIIRSQAPIAPAEAAQIAVEIAKALSYAHRHGVVHRDVKPGNVLITSDGGVKVTDFGIARAMGSIDQELTQTGLVMGTAAYFSPEQAQGLDVDGRTDIYALGIVLYEMLTGRPPFVGETPVSIAYQHVQEAPPIPRSINPSIPVALEAIVLRAIAKDANERYSTADELRDDLTRFVEEKPVHAEMPAATTAVTLSIPRTPGWLDTAAVPAQKVDEIAAVGRSTSRRWVVAGIVLFLVLAGLVVVGGRHLGYFGAHSTVKVPGLTKLTEGRATTNLKADGLKPKVHIVPGVVSTAGRVVSQDPVAAAIVKKGTTITLDVGGVPPKVSVPSVAGLPETAADQQLGAMGFQVSSKTVKQTNPSQFQGDVVRQNPGAQALDPKGATITISVVSGTALATVPTWANESAAEAGVLLVNAHLKLGTTSTGYSSAVPLGDVISSKPLSGASIKRGTAVELVISGGPGVQIPNLVGQNLQAAEAQLQVLGLAVNLGRGYETPNSGLWGNVAQINCSARPNDGQYPNCTTGTAVGPGATITLRVGRAPPGSDTTTTTSTTTAITLPSSST